MYTEGEICVQTCSLTLVKIIGNLLSGFMHSLESGICVMSSPFQSECNCGWNFKKQTDKTWRTFLTYMHVCVNMSAHSSYTIPVKMAGLWAWMISLCECTKKMFVSMHFHASWILFGWWFGSRPFSSFFFFFNFVSMSGVLSVLFWTQI